jgi:Zn-dependent protease
MAIEIGRLKIGGSALLALLAVYFFDSGEFLLAAAIAVLVHELGHLTALRIFKRRAAEIRLDLWGVTLRPDAPMSYRQEMITAAAGPAASLLLAGLAAWAGRAMNAPGLYLFAGSSLVFCIFNALPVYPLDGGTVVRAFACLFFGPDTAEKLVCILSCAVIFTLLAGGTVLLIATQVNFSLLLAAALLLFGYCQRSGIRIKSKGKNNGCESWIKS